MKLLEWISASIGHLTFDSALDLFGGTASVAYLLKSEGRQVAFNDGLKSNYLIGKALIENSGTTLSIEEVDRLLVIRDNCHYESFIDRTFRGVFFTDEENRWLDVVAQNISELKDPYKQALAFFGLFQAAMAKRPYNLFHRANLYMRTANVERSFGNKATWEKPFDELFRLAIHQANEAVFDNGRRNKALNVEPVAIRNTFDLVYIDPPYMNRQGVGVDYLDFYHFLEGLCQYDEWPNRIDHRYKHKPYHRQASPWCDKRRIHEAFEDIFHHFKSSILVVSYRDNGIPTPSELITMLKRHKRYVVEANNTHYKYVLSTIPSKEILLIAE